MTHNLSLGLVIRCWAEYPFQSQNEKPNHSQVKHGESLTSGPRRDRQGPLGRPRPPTRRDLIAGCARLTTEARAARTAPRSRSPGGLAFHSARCLTDLAAFDALRIRGSSWLRRSARSGSSVRSRWRRVRARACGGVSVTVSLDRADPGHPVAPRGPWHG